MTDCVRQTVPDGILQVARCGPVGVYALVDQYAELVLDALRYAQPVEVGKKLVRQTVPDGILQVAGVDPWACTHW